MHKCAHMHTHKHTRAHMLNSNSFEFVLQCFVSDVQSSVFQREQELMTKITNKCNSTKPF